MSTAFPMICDDYGGCNGANCFLGGIEPGRPETAENATAGPIVALLNNPVPEDLSLAGFRENDLLVSINKQGIRGGVLEDIMTANGKYPFFGFRLKETGVDRLDLEVELTGADDWYDEWATRVWLMSRVTPSYERAGLRTRDLITRLAGLSEDESLAGHVNYRLVRQVHGLRYWMASGIRLEWAGNIPVRKPFVAFVNVHSY